MILETKTLAVPWRPICTRYDVCVAININWNVDVRRRFRVDARIVNQVGLCLDTIAISWSRPSPPIPPLPFDVPEGKRITSHLIFREREIGRRTCHSFDTWQRLSKCVGVEKKKRKKKRIILCLIRRLFCSKREREINRIDLERSDVEFTTEGGIFLFPFFFFVLNVDTRCVNNNNNNEIRKKDRKEGKRQK